MTEKTLWLNWIKIEMDLLDKIVDAPGDVTKNDKVIGTVSEPLKKLYTLWQVTEKNSDEIALKVKYGEVQLDDIITRLRELKWKGSALEAIFWTCVKEEFELWDEPSIGIRKNHTIVVAKQQGGGFGHLFQQFFGGGND
jgi:hypothetical protein